MKRDAAVRTCAAVLLALSQGGLRAAETTAAPAPAVQVSAKGVVATGLLREMASLTAQNLLVYGVPTGTRVDVSGEFSGPEDFFQRLADQLGMKAQKEGGVNVLAPPCAENIPQRYPFLSQHKLGMDFQDMEVKVLLEVFKDFQGLQWDAASLSQWPSGRITLRVKDLPGERALSATLMAAGLRLVPGEGGAFRFEKVPGRPGCDMPAGHASGHAGFQPPPPPRIDQGGRVDIRREPLENYELEDIVLRGHVKTAGKAFGLVETPDGMVRGVRMGNYLGRNYGKVVEVLPERLRIREIKRNMFGLWQEVSLDLEQARPAFPIGASLYEETLQDLQGYVGFVLHAQRYCSAHAVDRGAHHAAAMKGWLASNARELAELDAHVRAYADRQANGAQGGQRADALMASASAWFSDTSRRLLEAKVAASGVEPERHCAAYADFITREQSRLRENHAAEFVVLRNCEAAGHCANLGRFRRP